mgnify:CR=1 FL=1
MNSAAFIVIAVLTLAAALAAATLSKLVHAALCFAAAFVGVAAFAVRLLFMQLLSERIIVRVQELHKLVVCLQVLFSRQVLLPILLS